jgi:hypothetical protein
VNENQLLNQNLINLDTFFGNSNQTTLSSYEKRTFEYVKSVQPYHNELQRWIDFSLSVLPKKPGRILEIGSATPRDAKYMRSLGHQVDCSDAIEGFLEFLQKNGEKPLKLNILADPIPSDYNMIFANAVFPHMTETEMKYIIKKVYNSLSSKAIFAFSLKQGDGEGWITEKFSDKRFVKYWQPEQITHLLEKNDFKLLFLDTNIIGDLPNHRWINIVAQKQ